MRLSGRAWTTQCEPLAGARLEFWQTNSAGRYDFVGHDFRGLQRTDEQGGFVLDTVMPGAYLGPRHIHFLLSMRPPGRLQPLLLSGVVWFPTTEEFDQQPPARRIPELIPPQESGSIRDLLMAPCNLVVEAPEARAVGTPLTPTFGWEDLPEYRGWVPGTPEIPLRSSLLEPGIDGQRLQLTGRVLNRKGVPLPGVKLEFWHADGAGNYDPKGQRLRGIQRSDADGRFTLDTILPGCAAGRMRHINFIATANWAGWSPQNGDLAPSEAARIPNHERPLQLAAAIYFATDSELDAPIRAADRAYVPPGAVRYRDDPAYLPLRSLPIRSGVQRASYDIVFDIG